MTHNSILIVPFTTIDEFDVLWDLLETIFGQNTGKDRERVWAVEYLRFLAPDPIGLWVGRRWTVRPTYPADDVYKGPVDLKTLQRWLSLQSL